MIKWKIKPENLEKRDEFYFAKDGFCIKTMLDGAVKRQSESISIAWILQIYYYTNSHKNVIFEEVYYAKFDDEQDVYESNVKRGATKLAKKFMYKYANRANMFFGAIAS